MPGEVNLKLDVPDVWTADRIGHREHAFYRVAKAGGRPIVNTKSEANACVIAKALSICEALGCDVAAEIDAETIDRFLQVKVTLAGTPGPITVDRNTRAFAGSVTTSKSWSDAEMRYDLFEGHYHSHVSCTGKGRDLVVTFHEWKFLARTYDRLTSEEFSTFRLPNGNVHSLDKSRPFIIRDLTLTIPVLE